MYHVQRGRRRDRFLEWLFINFIKSWKTSAVSTTVFLWCGNTIHTPNTRRVHVFCTTSHGSNLRASDCWWHATHRHTPHYLHEYTGHTHTHTPKREDRPLRKRVASRRGPLAVCSTRSACQTLCLCCRPLPATARAAFGFPRRVRPPSRHGRVVLLCLFVVVVVYCWIFVPRVSLFIFFRLSVFSSFFSCWKNVFLPARTTLAKTPLAAMVLWCSFCLFVFFSCCLLLSVLVSFLPRVSLVFLPGFLLAIIFSCERFRPTANGQEYKYRLYINIEYKYCLLYTSPSPRD